MTNDGWARELTDRVAAEVKARRGEHTVQWLSDRTADYGHRISRSRISDLERGDRGGLLGVAELLVLAAALEMPPVLLLFPGIASEPVEIVPGETVESWDAVRWFTGEQAPKTGRVRLPSENVWTLRTLRELADVDRQVDQAKAQLETYARSPEGDNGLMVNIWTQRVEGGVAERGRIVRELADRGVPVGPTDATDVAR